jgi:SagB-type dehydrogenase family enzyme
VTETALRCYHERTKHHPRRPSANPYGLEWGNEPDLFKHYPGIEGEPPPEGLARLLGRGAGVHPRRGDPHFRVFMSAGALHPVELYVGASGGLWHYHPGERAVRRLRAEDPRAALAAAAAEPALAQAAYILVLTGILWRTAWKYGPRGWRHIFWDAGAMLANLLALAGTRIRGYCSRSPTRRWPRCSGSSHPGRRRSPYSASELTSRPPPRQSSSRWDTRVRPSPGASIASPRPRRLKPPLRLPEPRR